jgi:outer membrane protein OmpA-like peptidoglycan-associated protein
MKKITLIILLFCVGFINAQEVKLENYTIKNIASNTKYQDYGVSFFEGNTIIFASTRRDKSIRNRVWIGNKQPFLELYKGVKNENGEISAIEMFSKKINSKYHDADVTFSKDFQTMYFSRNNYFNDKYKKDTTGWNLIQLYKAQKSENGDWEVMQMPFNNDNYQTGHPVLNDKEDKLYFISDMPGGFGKTDIYVVDIYKDGTYSEPKNLGPNVNTNGKEMFPFVDEFDVLYFSSDGYLDGFGDLDIYACNLRNGEPVTNAKNIGMPINSYKDDFGLVYKKGANHGYFSSKRPGGKGDDDIYYFEALQRIDLDCNQLAKGVVLDSETGLVIPQAKVTLFDKEGVKLDSIASNNLGEFSFNVNCNANYKVIATKENYNQDVEVFITSNVDDVALNLDLNISPSEFVTIRGLLMVNINPIYFDLDKSDIRDDAAIEIEKVVRIMKKYPEIKIDLGSYTDSRAPDQYNLELSNRRAKSSIEWMISRGIDPARITGKGYGETQLVNECSNGVKCSNAQHQLNRRTEFVIVNPEVIK